MRPLFTKLCVLLLTLPAWGGDRDHAFDGSMSETVLRNYLSRAMTMMESLQDGSDNAENIRMFTGCGGKFFGRGVYLWGGESRLPAKLEEAKLKIEGLHEADPDIIVQACIFEIISKDVDRIPVPAWAFEDLGLPVETRNFRYDDIIYADGSGRKWNDRAQVPDVSRPETKLWFQFLARSYIDIGCEAIHIGQVELMDGHDPDLAHWSEVLERMRGYARSRARRHFLVLDAHVPGGGFLKDGKLLLDFHSFPARVKEDPGQPKTGTLEVGHTDALYGRSKGGITPSGWRCDHLPYLVELDNYGSSRSPGEPGQGQFWVWGWDEITWFSQLPAKDRDAWLRHAWSWVRTHDPEGYLQMPGARMISRAPDGKRVYRANNPGDACPDGYGQEDTIREIWAMDGSPGPAGAD
ncbi:hypothetical protein [Luteolibacter marinus]|uniref:hypothetical protein n=1 Tax=Luteolibacter marinus TaxID=2776705 RepID=UPI0018684F67|nr:hypothetical protein [Luteolibacter marinus]